MRVLRSVQLAGTRCRAIASRHRSSTRLAQHTSCWPSWAPRVKPLVRLYCPGLSVRGGPMQVDDVTYRGLIPYGARRDLRADVLPAFEARLHHQARRTQKCGSGRITVSFLRPTELEAAHKARHRQTLGRYGVLVVARRAEALDHALRTRRNPRPRRTDGFHQYICFGLTGQRTARFGDLSCLISTLAIPVGGSKAPSAPAAPPTTKRRAVRSGHR